MIKFCFLGKKYKPAEKDVSTVNLLLKELNPASLPIDKRQIVNLVENSHWVVAIDTVTGGIIGMATLGTIVTLRGLKGHMEDVVVDKNYQGKGLGRKLVELLIKKAKSLGVKSLELTSRPSRVAANHLYQKIGFELRATNAYKMDL